eukprot:g6485.t1
MNAPLLAALASPGAKPARRPANPSSAVGPKTPTRTAPELGKENESAAAAAAAMGSPRPRAPSSTVLEPPSTPGRMENLRVLIEEGKKAAAEGRLAAALRKYETAMVTLPQAYKPRLQKKIARLEARLDDEEDRAPGTPARSTPRACRHAAESSDKDPGLLDLLRIAVQDVGAASASASAAAAAASSGRTATSGVSFCSPRRSSPLARELTGSGEVMAFVPCIAGASVLPRDEEDGGGGSGGGGGLDGDIARLGNGLTASSLAVATAASIKDDSYRSPTTILRPAGEKTGGGGGGGSGDEDGDRRVHAIKASGFCSGEEEASQAGIGTDDNDHCGLGEAEDGAEEDSDKGEAAGLEGMEGMEGMDTQERLRVVNRGLSDKLEKQVVAVMNQASSQELTDLHGIGPRRAQLIVQTRATTPFETLADLTRIGMYPKQIVKMGRHNMLECLDVCPAKMEDAGDSSGSSSP